MAAFLIFYFLLILLVIIIVVAAMRGSKKLVTKKPQNTVKITTKLDTRSAVKEIVNLASEKNYEIDNFDLEKKIIILSKPISFFSNGFFFPIYLSEENGELVIEIGITSKAVQIGPIPTRFLERCVSSIKAYLYCSEQA